MPEPFGPLRDTGSLDLGSRFTFWLLASLLLGGFAACAAAEPKLPTTVVATSQTVAGVAWFDDGNGSVDSGETPLQDGVSHLGLGTHVLATEEKAATDDHGGFVLAIPDLAGPDDQLFVQITVPIEGVAGEAIDMHIRRDVRPGDITVQVPITRPSRCDGSVDRVVEGGAACGQAQLPDLVPLVADFGQPPTNPIATASARIDLTTLAPTPLLRFASATANLGAGPLHMIPERDPDNGQIPTWQRVWTDDQSFVDHRTGSFVFHEGHDHFHLDGFEQYRLLSAAGDVIAVGEKVSFCLIDALPATPDAQTRGQGIFLDAVCEQAGQQQALNPGWADYYGAGLPDQWIDISGVAPGEYLVEIIVDPDNVLLESDETNNRATFPVTITAADLAGTASS